MSTGYFYSFNFVIFLPSLFTGFEGAGSSVMGLRAMGGVTDVA